MKKTPQEHSSDTDAHRSPKTKSRMDRLSSAGEPLLVALDINLAQALSALLAILALVTGGIMLPSLMRGSNGVAFLRLLVPLLSSLLALTLYLVSARSRHRSDFVARIFVTHRIRARRTMDRAMETRNLDAATAVLREEALRKLSDEDPKKAITAVQEIIEFGSTAPFPEGFDALARYMACSKDWALKLRIAEGLARVATLLQDWAVPQQDREGSDVR